MTRTNICTWTRMARWCFHYYKGQASWDFFQFCLISDQLWPSWRNWNAGFHRCWGDWTVPSSGRRGYPHSKTIEQQDQRRGSRGAHWCRGGKSKQNDRPKSCFHHQLEPWNLCKLEATNKGMNKIMLCTHVSSFPLLPIQIVDLSKQGLSGHIYLMSN